MPRLVFVVFGLVGIVGCDQGEVSDVGPRDADAGAAPDAEVSVDAGRRQQTIVFDVGSARIGTRLVVPLGLGPGRTGQHGAFYLREGEVTFTPSVAGPYVAELPWFIADDVDGTLRLEGVGVEHLVLQSPGDIGFGEVSLGQRAQLRVAFTLPGDASTAAIAADSLVPLCGEHTGSMCAELVGRPAGRVEVDLFYAPTALGLERSSLAMDWGTSRTEVVVDGIGAGQVSWVCGPRRLELGDILVGECKTDFVDCTHAGAAVEALPAARTRGLDGALSAQTSSVGPAEVARTSIELCPTATGAIDGAILIEGLEVLVRGNAIARDIEVVEPPLRRSWAAPETRKLTFDLAWPGAERAQVVTVRNRGPVAATPLTGVEGPGADAYTLFGPGALAPDEVGTITVVFSPRAAGLQTATLFVEQTAVELEGPAASVRPCDVPSSALVQTRDAYETTIYRPVDVLFVVDASPSMQDWLPSLRDGLPGLLARYADPWQGRGPAGDIKVGVISADGHRASGAATAISRDVEDVAGVLADFDAATAQVSDSFEAAGSSAIDLEGFARPGGAFIVVLITDEPDQTPGALLQRLLQQDLSWVIATVACGTHEVLTRAVDHWPSRGCEGEWWQVLFSNRDDVGFPVRADGAVFLWPDSELRLGHPASAQSIALTVDGADLPPETAEGAPMWTYDVDNQQILLTPFGASAASGSLRIEYLPQCD